MSHVREFILGGLIRRPVTAAQTATVGYIAGTVQIEGVPARRRVLCLDRTSGLIAGTTWSDFDGSYRFDGLTPEHNYTILALDYELEYNAVVADNVVPVPGGPVVAPYVEELLPPYGLQALYNSIDEYVRLSWLNLNHTQEAVVVYRSLSPMDPENLPPPLVTLGAFDTSYEDTSIVTDETYYYRLSVTRQGEEVVGPEVVREISAGVNGYWITSVACWGAAENRYLDPSDTEYVTSGGETWAERFGETIGYVFDNFLYQASGPVDTGNVSAAIPVSPLGIEFRISSSNGTWSQTRADIDMEFQREDGSVIAVMRLARDGNYRHGIWYGADWGSLTKAPQIGSYPRTEGFLRFDNTGFEYERDPEATVGNGLNDSFRFDVDMSEVAKINIPYARAYMDYTGGSGSTTRMTLLYNGEWPPV